MLIATWNINSIRQRLPHLLRWLSDTKPDVVLLQETKVSDDQFPAIELEDLGYNLAFHGQKTFNGVAILSKYPLEDVIKTLPGNDEDDHCRYIEALVLAPQPVRVASVYVPNGQSPDSDKFIFKMHFFERLRAHAAQLLALEEPLVIGGDYNVAPENEDVKHPQRAFGHICFHPREREHFRALEWQGLYDAFRLKHPDDRRFSWWDYRGGAFEMDIGMRIDHLLLSSEAVDRLHEADIDTAPRQWDKPSDHTPVWCRLAA
jgi:exodeoxyribonuclease III